MNRLRYVLKKSKTRKKKLVCAYLTAGFRSLSETEKLIIRFEQLGIDVIELGFPFSDPLADGPTIQYASDYALRKGVTLAEVLRLVKRLRRRGCRVPIIFFSYFNPIQYLGVAKFARQLKSAGFDGVIIPDLIPEEAVNVERAVRKEGLSLVYLVAPTTEKHRMKWIARKSDGFVYYVSLRGVTGARKQLSKDMESVVRQLKRYSSKPVLVGFGVSTPSHVREICEFADGVIVGSAIVDSIRKDGRNLSKTSSLVRSLAKAAGSDA